MDKLLRFNFEYRVEISYFIFFLALCTLMMPDSALLYRKAAEFMGTSPETGMKILFLIIAFVNIAAGILRSSACAHISSFVMMKKEVQTKKVIAAGPYAYVRNPIYLSDIIAMTAVAFAGNIYSLAVLFFGKVISSFLFCLYEEYNLLKYLGDDYKDYYDRVPRFIPKFYPYHKAEVLDKPDYKDGILNSFYPFGIAVGFLAAAFTGTYMHIFIFGGISAAVWFYLYKTKK